MRHGVVDRESAARIGLILKYHYRLEAGEDVMGGFDKSEQFSPLAELNEYLEVTLPPPEIANSFHAQETKILVTLCRELQRIREKARSIFRPVPLPLCLNMRATPQPLTG